LGSAREAEAVDLDLVAVGGEAVMPVVVVGKRRRGCSCDHDDSCEQNEPTARQTGYGFVDLVREPA
jgi:hypothetical protein